MSQQALTLLRFQQTDTGLQCEREEVVLSDYIQPVLNLNTVDVKSAANARQHQSEAGDLFGIIVFQNQTPITLDNFHAVNLKRVVGELPNGWNPEAPVNLSPGHFIESLIQLR